MTMKRRASRHRRAHPKLAVGGSATDNKAKTTTVVMRSDIERDLATLATALTTLTQAATEAARKNAQLTRIETAWMAAQVTRGDTNYKEAQRLFLRALLLSRFVALGSWVAVARSLQMTAGGVREMRTRTGLTVAAGGRRSREALADELQRAIADLQARQPGTQVDDDDTLDYHTAKKLWTRRFLQRRIERCQSFRAAAKSLGIHANRLLDLRHACGLAPSSRSAASQSERSSPD